eukprot:IDg8245t1
MTLRDKLDAALAYRPTKGLLGSGAHKSKLVCSLHEARGEYHGATLSNVITAVVGPVSSNSSEQAAGLLECARNMPVVDMA